MTTFSCLSHLKRLPRTTGTINFDIDKVRAAPPRQKSVGVAAPPRMVHAASDPSRCGAPSCENATRAARRLPRIRAILVRPRSQDHGHHSFAAALVDYLQANFDRAWQERRPRRH